VTEVAFVTGASRGIGRAGALALADAGYDVVVTARTVRAGDRFDYGPTVSEAGTERALPGSIEETAEEIEKRGRRALPIRLDLTERETLDAAVAETLHRWGRIDVLFNNGIYQGPGVMDRFVDLPEDKLALVFEGNFFGHVHLTRLVLAHMLERGGGTVVNMTSTSALRDPKMPTGEGGWGFAYAASKAALHRMAGILHIELHELGIRAYNLDPGFVFTEAQRKILGEENPIYKIQVEHGAPEAVPAAVLVWLLTTDEGRSRSGESFHAPSFCAERGLVPGWPRGKPGRPAERSKS
jgi:NAD(P)-dependent dehydrogenase (short-subunit alcohol dehydrogenase family)